MKAILFLCSSLLFLKTNTWGQYSSVFEITNDTANYPEMDPKYWEVFEDLSGKLTIDEISAASFAKNFHTDSSRYKGINNVIHVYWFRVCLRNATPEVAKIVFENIPRSEKYDLYIVDSANIRVHKTSGEFVPYNKRDGYKAILSIPVTINPGQAVTVYKRIFRATAGYNARDHLSMGFYSENLMVQNNYVNIEPFLFLSILHAFTFGVLILACLLNFFFYYVNREKIYWAFALFLFFEGLVFFPDLYQFFLRDYPKIYAYANPLDRVLAYFFLTYFVRQLLHTKRNFPRWDKLLVSLSILPALFTLSALFIEPFMAGKWNGIFWISNTCSIAILLVSLLITFIFFKKETNRPIKVVLAAVLPALCLWALNFGFVYVFGILKDRFGNPGVTGLVKFIDKWSSNQEVIETVCLCWLAVVFSWILFLRYSQLRKENAQQAIDKERLSKEREMERSLLIAQQKDELESQVAERTFELKQSLEELKSTQAQLIQSEKMASLGELTAGIAHEIQNPLNFVNNFSEVNKEMIAEMKEEIDKSNYEEVKLIANSIEENEEKINHHGKRADAIVKGMLQHSRASFGKKEPTDINVLCDECLRLAYHGLRAKDKSFNAEIKTDFDGSIGKINIVPQEIGRVLLNLVINAFYAVGERHKVEGLEYEPTVTVSTKKLGDKVEIKVKDNGSGVPQKIAGKIFQPFFTTKPTGQGTGLGLSLAYDIVKAHGGEIKVETKEGEGSEFIIQLPVV